MRSIDRPPRHELYRICEDPGETTDLAAKHPEIVSRMKMQYDTWFTDVTRRWPEQPAAEDSLLPRGEQQSNFTPKGGSPEQKMPGSHARCS